MAVKIHFFLITVSVIIAEGHGQEITATCYGAGSITGAVLGTFVGTLFLIGGLLYLYKRRIDAKKENHLILETDPERGPKAEYAFDNPGFKDASILTTSEKYTKPESSNNKTNKWTHWSPLSALNLKPEKKRALDDSALQNCEVKVVALKSQDFTGLGFNICGNMKEGIYIRDILHRGPAFESGKLNPGDRINSVTISFEHMVYEDALNILSYASPYEVILEAKSGKTISFQQGQGQTPVHPIYRTSSAIDLSLPEKSSKKKLFGDDYSSSSNYSSLQKSRSNVTTLERKESKSPRPPGQPKSRKPEIIEHYEKFGVRVLPIDHQKSPKVMEQNQNNANIEKHNNFEEIPIRSIDEVDRIKPQARKREKKSPEHFERNGSGIKRDSNGIPLEIPDHMQDAAIVARRNRKSSTENVLSEESNKRHKPKAPSPPPQEVKINFSLGSSKLRAFEDLSTLGTDSEDDTNNMSSVNTIELNSSDITIHQIQEEERKSRKTASTGDLSKMKKTPRSNNGTLERAQSLDITDTASQSLSKKRTYDATENLLIDKEPRLSLILDGLTTFQRNRLKSSAEWGNLEDAILNFKTDDEDWEQRRKSEPQFNAVMDRVIQIKRESQETIPDEVIRSYEKNTTNAPKVFNKLWPDEDEINFQNSGWKKLETKQIPNKKSLEIEVDDAVRQAKVPVAPERNKLKIEPSKPAERTLKNDLSVQIECIKPLPPKREISDKCSTEINLNHNICKVSPKTAFEKQNITELCSQLAKCKPSQMIKDEWEVDTLNDTSPPQSMTFVDEVMDSYNKNFGVVQAEKMESLPDNIIVNCPDECKNIKLVINDFIFNERNAHRDQIVDRNIPDDVKVSRSSIESLETKKVEFVSKNKDDSENNKKSDEFEPNLKSGENIKVSRYERLDESENVDDDIKTSKILFEKVKLAQKIDKSDDNIEILTNNCEKVTSKPEGNLKVSTSKTLFSNETIPKIEEEVKVSTKSWDKSTLKSEENQDNSKSSFEVIETPTIDDDVKVSTSLFEKIKISTNPIEKLKPPPKSDDAKHEDLLISHVTVAENGSSNLHSLEFSINNEPSEFTLDKENDVTVTVSQPNVVAVKKIDESLVEITESSFSKVTNSPVEISTVEVQDEASKVFKSIDDESPAISLADFNSEESSAHEKKTYVTEIQVLTNPNNISEIEVNTDDHLENAFENYVKNFEKKLETFESNMENFENNLEEFIHEEPLILEEKIDIEKQVSKIQEIAEEQLKTLPEMKFSTSSYESAGRKTPDKRHSFELLRSNFEKTTDKSPPRKDSIPKSRIPISTTMKTPPMSPERRDSRNLENENDKALLELMKSPPPFTSKIKPPSTSTKNISVTSIRQNSKIPSGLPTLSSRPPIPPRKMEDNLQVSSNGSVESSFKQWVFNPNSNVTNVTVGKEK